MLAVVLGSLLRLASTAATVLVVLGFALFAIDELDEGSKTQLARLDNEFRPSPSKDVERVREREHGAVREAIDDANDVLLSPFAGMLSDSGSSWVRHGVPALLAFLGYGVLLRLLANYLPQPRPPAPKGWETPR
jgi:hypothetical protein